MAESGSNVGPKIRVFISYSHEDAKWFGEKLGPARYTAKARSDRPLIATLIKSIEAFEAVEFWYDQRRLVAGDDWRDEIEQAIRRSQIAILLLSWHFLNSDYIRNHEMPCIEKCASDGKLVIIPILVGSCNWRLIPSLDRPQMLPSSTTPLAQLANDDAEWDRVQNEIITEIHEQIRKVRKRLTIAPPLPLVQPDSSPPPPPPRWPRWVGAALAALSILAIGLGGAFYLRHHWPPDSDRGHPTPDSREMCQQVSKFGSVTPTKTPTPTIRSIPTIPGGPETPAIEFTEVPPCGSFRDLRGRVSGVWPADHRVVVYIFLETCSYGWWGPKPYFAEPPTRISADGSWSVDITTGGCDQEATKIVAYLVPVGYEPPPLEAAASLPPELDTHAVAKREAIRTRP